MNNRKRLQDAFAEKVHGKKILSAFYERSGGDFYPIIELEGGACLVIQRDDECNGAGVPVYFDSQDERGTGLWQVGDEE